MSWKRVKNLVRHRSALVSRKGDARPGSFYEVKDDIGLRLKNVVYSPHHFPKLFLALP